MRTINQDHIMYGSWDIKPKGQSFLSFWSIFSALNLLATPEIKILKKKNITWRYYHFTLMYQQWRSYDVSFLRYQVQQTKCFVILGHVLPFEPPNNPRNKNKKKKKTWRYYHFTVIYQQWRSFDVSFLKYQGQPTDIVFCHFSTFFALLPPD